MTNKRLHSFCKRILSASTIEEAITILERFVRRLPEKKKRGTWGYWGSRMLSAMNRGEVAFSIFAKGNGKLPFYAFSALPKYTCPGAGECLSWCYSFRAWRYPAAFYRQLQNTLLLKFSSDTIAQAYLELPSDVDVRLYVDGDFESTERVAFWMSLCNQRADLRNYGYSKSWAQLIEFDLNGGHWAANYVLNISSGSVWEGHATYQQAIENLPITRGKFVAVPIDGDGLPSGFKRYESREYHSRVRAAIVEHYGKRGFSCTGLCGSCSASGHMCGSHRADNIVIGIGIH